jgi:hypothetical protein
VVAHTCNSTIGRLRKEFDASLDYIVISKNKARRKERRKGGSKEGWKGERKEEGRREEGQGQGKEGPP